jgi:dipeptidase
MDLTNTHLKRVNALARQIERETADTIKQIHNEVTRLVTAKDVDAAFNLSRLRLEMAEAQRVLNTLSRNITKYLNNKTIIN